MTERLTHFTHASTGEPGDLFVRDGRFVEPGPADTVRDLGGARLLPAFVDCHCHVLPAGLDYLKLNLGGCATREAILDSVRDRHASQPEGWLLAVHYDQTKLGGVHLTRAELDSIDSARPILLRHVSGHASVANSGALAAAGIDEGTPDPPGGTFQRDEAGRMNGVLLEDAHEIVSAAAPMPSPDEMVEAILLAGRRMADWNIAGACDMMTGRFDLLQELDAYERAATLGNPVEVRLFVQWKTVFGPRGLGVEAFRERISALRGVRVAGIKIFADGAIGSATAAIYGQYSGAKPVGRRIARGARSPGTEGVSGQLIYSAERLGQMVQIAHEAGFQVATHAIGDHAVDLLMDAYEATGEPGRHRIEHAMLLSDAQIERIARLGCPVTFQPEFLARFGETYRRQLGPERARSIKRTRSLLATGIPLGFSSDLPIVTGEPSIGLGAAMDRPTGFDPAENVSWADAHRLYTEGSAQIGGFEGLGRLEPGCRAVYQVLEPAG